MGSKFSPSEFLNPSLLSILSQSFVFTDLDPSDPTLADLGLCRVSHVIISENWFPELGLISPKKPDCIEYFPIEHLDISPDPESTKPFPSKLFNSYTLRVINVKHHKLTGKSLLSNA